MQNFQMPDASVGFKSALPTLMACLGTALSQNSGSTFPVRNADGSNIFVGMPFYNSYEKKLYTLTSIDPDVWSLTFDLNHVMLHSGDVIDNLVTTAPDQPLSARMGAFLNTALKELTDVVNTKAAKAITVNGYALDNNISLTYTDVGAAPEVHKHQYNSIIGILPNSVVIADGNGVLNTMPVTTNEIGYLSGVTSSVQSQLNSRVTGPNATVDGEIVLFNGAGGTSIRRMTGSGILRVVNGVATLDTNSYLTNISQSMVLNALGYTPENVAKRNTANGYATLSGWDVKLFNQTGVIQSLLINTNTATRTYTLPDKSGTVALVSDISGTNSGTNTGDETQTSIALKLNGVYFDAGEL